MICDTTWHEICGVLDTYHLRRTDTDLDLLVKYGQWYLLVV